MINKAYERLCLTGYIKAVVMKGFQTASLAVVGIMVTGAIIAAFHQTYDPSKDRPVDQASPAAADD